MAPSSDGWAQPSLPQCQGLAQGPWHRARAAPPSEAHPAASKLVSPGVVITGKSVVRELHLLPRNNSCSILPAERGITVAVMYCFTGYKIQHYCSKGFRLCCTLRIVYFCCSIIECCIEHSLNVLQKLQSGRVCPLCCLMNGCQCWARSFHLSLWGGGGNNRLQLPTMAPSLPD